VLRQALGKVQLGGSTREFLEVVTQRRDECRIFSGNFVGRREFLQGGPSEFPAQILAIPTKVAATVRNRKTIKRGSCDGSHGSLK